MKTKTIIFISIALTTMILIIVSGAVLASSPALSMDLPTSISNPSKVSGNQTNLPGQTAQTTDAQLQQTILYREAAYQAVIAEANARLLQAQKDKQQYTGQNQSEPIRNQTIPQPTSVISLPSQQAVLSAQKILGIQENPIKQPELVSLEGKIVYEIVFPQSVAYVDLNGQVISPQPNTNPPLENYSDQDQSTNDTEKEGKETVDSEDN